MSHPGTGTGTTPAAPRQVDRRATAADAPAGPVADTSDAASGAGEVRRSARSGAVGLVGAAVNGALGFLLTVVIVRGFGTDGSGALFTAIGVVSILGAICCAGADTALVWALPRRRTGVDGDAARLLPVALLPVLLLTGVVATVGAFTADRLAPVFFERSDGPTLLRLAFLALPVTVAMTVLLAAVRAVRPVTAVIGIQYVLVPLARPVLLLATVATGAGVAVGFGGWLLPVALAVVAAAVLLLRPLGVLAGARLRPDGADWRTLWGFALPRAVSAAIDASSMWVGVLLTAALAGADESGVFGAVGRYALAGLLIMQGLRVAVAPQLSRLLGQGRTADAALVYRRVTVVIILLSWPAYLLLAVFAPGFLSLFGDGFTVGAAPLAVLAFAMLVNSGVGIVQTMLLMSGNSTRHLQATVVGLALTVGLGFLLIPDHGALGAAYAWTAGVVAENVLAAIAARVAIGEPLLTRSVGWAALGAGGGAAVVAVLSALVAGRGVAGLALALAVLAVVAAGLLLDRRVRGTVRAAVTMLRPKPA
ncbi:MULTISPECIES: lipopolysaccharide biosynthesis protein [unclassified Micromonospora]|uniref:lipopolysaccharide biosynthesis protein n=1 Tax=unclassified Micromonospora TaxID=2617518 RepID=UPI001C5F1E13|nr:polysaccharide biosynthesis C-terminal domain-containing protein [Micromonospora sp. RL09-050-HVF-A]MBW4706076.1 polysaccharide biosynthesis C-terminal domain-containing protein [Micromonospora sp. RL09-050-HVF-A]